MKRVIFTLIVVGIVIFSSVIVLSRGENGITVKNPPQKEIRVPAQWEKSEKILIRWPYDYSGLDTFFENMAKEIADVCHLEVVVDSQSTESDVSNELQNYGVNMANVSFFIVTTDSIWIRDYGPISIEDVSSGDIEYVNMMYDRFNRWNDDAFPWRYAKSNNVAWYNMSNGSSWLRLEGGNFLVDGAGIEYSTNRIFEQNDPNNGGDLNHDEVIQWMTSYYNLWEFRNVTMMTNDGTGHIDMEIKLLNETTVLISQINDTSDEDYPVLEYNARYFENHTARNGMHYNIVRVPLVKSNGVYYTYSNSLIVNNKVLVPIYGLSTDSEALQDYQNAMPGYQIVGIDASSIIDMNGAIHCTTMQIPEQNIPPNISVYPVNAVTGENITVKVHIEDDQGIKWAKLFYNTSQNTEIKVLKMKDIGNNDYEAYIPAQVAGTTVNFYVETMDLYNAVNYSGDVEEPHTITVGNIPEFSCIPMIFIASAIILLRRRE